MRTDVKIGLISLFVIVLGVVGYFAWQSQRDTTKSSDYQPTNQTGLVNSDNAGHSSHPADTFGPGTIVIPPPTSGPAAATQSLTGGMPVRDAFPPVTPTLTTAPGTTYPTTFGTIGGPGAVSIEAPGTRRAIDFSDSTSTLTDTATSDTGSKAASGNTYKVKKGDTFRIIAKSLKTTVAALESANPGVSSNKLKIGQELNIPADAGASAKVTSTETTAKETGTSATTSKKTVKSTAKATTPGSHPATYTVKKGDTLSKIAKKFYGTEKAWPRIVRANRDVLNRDGSNLDVGMELRLPE